MMKMYSGGGCCQVLVRDNRLAGFAPRGSRARPDTGAFFVVGDARRRVQESVHEAGSALRLIREEGGVKRGRMTPHI